MHSARLFIEACARGCYSSQAVMTMCCCTTLWDKAAMCNKSGHDRMFRFMIAHWYRCSTNIGRSLEIGMMATCLCIWTLWSALILVSGHQRNRGKELAWISEVEASACELCRSAWFPSSSSSSITSLIWSMHDLQQVITCSQRYSQMPRDKVSSCNTCCATLCSTT